MRKARTATVSALQCQRTILVTNGPTLDDDSSLIPVNETVPAYALASLVKCGIDARHGWAKGND